MRLFAGTEIAALTPYPALIDAMARGLARPLVSPPRGVYQPAGAGDVLLTMPAWRPPQGVAPAGLIGVKLVTVYPANPARGLPSIAGVYVAFDGASGQPRAVLDGTVLTVRRTAAASALAARYLAPADAKTLLTIGTGALAPELARAHAADHRFAEVMLWGRDSAKAAALAARLAAEGLPATASIDLASAVRRADVIVAGTTARQPFLERGWIRPGSHLSLLGAFTSAMAEADQATVAAARLFADTRDGVIEKGGEVAQAIAAGAIAAERIEADLAGLIARAGPIARRPDDITLFKSVGFAALDLAAAEFVLERAAAGV